MLLYKCDRCGGTAEPKAGTRQEGPNASPKPPDDWREVTIHLGAGKNGVQLICKPCDIELTAWFERTSEFDPELIAQRQAELIQLRKQHEVCEAKH